jgi:hypothetical protein
VIAGLESEFKESFLEVTKAKGYPIGQAGVMRAKYWTAMVESANLRTTRQTVISRFLFHHFGHWVVVPQRQLAAMQIAICNVWNVYQDIQWKESSVLDQDITVLLEFYLPQMLESFNKTIDKIELTLVGGEHGKGAFAFIARLIVRFDDPLEEPQVL